MERFAVISDIHGNAEALEAVLADATMRSITGGQILCLGDVAWGVLDPAETIDIMMDFKIHSIAGNTERYIQHPSDAQRASVEYAHVHSQLKAKHLHWIKGLKMSYSFKAQSTLVRLAHGTPESDEATFLETVTHNGLRLATQSEMVHRLADIDEQVVFCGHTHVPRMAWLDEALIVNPGSVGLPAYYAASPFPHAMESGTPHAKYVIVEWDYVHHTWLVQQYNIPYDWESAAKTAEQRGRPDWAQWLRTGRVGF